jgi:nucleoside-diphosphate-sugar epimerase
MRVPMKDTVLVLGASGRMGRNAATAFENVNWEVRRFNRATDSLWDVAWGASVIVNAWNPAYPDWEAQLPELTETVIEVAKATGATVILPGNVYVFGETAPAALTADTPHLATNGLGRLRINMEAAYRAAGVRTIVLRAGDFLDTQASGNWFDLVMAKTLPKGRLTMPGPVDVPHAYAFLPDVAKAMVQLANTRDTLATFEDVPFPGYTLTGEDMARGLRDALDRPVTAKPMAWLTLQIARPFWPMARYLVEMRYLWSKRHHLDDAKFKRLLPLFQATPLEEALTIATRHLVQDQIHPNYPMPTSGHTVRS